MPYFDSIPEFMPASFKIEQEQETLKLSYQNYSWRFLILFLVGLLLTGSQLRSLPGLLKALAHPDPPISWTLAYPENLGWLAPLAYGLFTLAAAGTAYAGLALWLDKRIVVITPETISSYERPLPLGKKQTIHFSAIERIDWKLHTVGTGIATSLSYPVYLTLKNGHKHGLASYDDESSARFLHSLLTRYLQTACRAYEENS